MDNDDIKLLLVKYITDQATDTEINEVKHWIGLHPENELYFVELYEVWQNMLNLRPEAIDEEKAFALFTKKALAGKRVIYMRKWGNIAAVLFILLASPIIFIYLKKSKHTNNSHQLTVQNGHVKKIILADNTIVWLNAGSRLNYNAGFGKTNRTVYLEGEAFFDIGHTNKQVPFIVKTKNYTIRDIGTKFNLKAYPNDPFFETTVIKGEVAVEDNSDAGTSNNANRIYVKPHQVLKIFYHPEQSGNKKITHFADTYNEVSMLQVDSAKMDIYDGWKENLLVFDGNTLSEISKVLERRYNVQIMLKDDGLQNIRYSGSFKNVPDIASFLQIIKQNTPIDYVIDGNNITINKNNN
jgi:transmembrane sensor